MGGAVRMTDREGRHAGTARGARPTCRAAVEAVCASAARAARRARLPRCWDTRRWSTRSSSGIGPVGWGDLDACPTLTPDHSNNLTLGSRNGSGRYRTTTRQIFAERLSSMVARGFKVPGCVRCLRGVRVVEQAFDFQPKSRSCRIRDRTPEISARRSTRQTMRCCDR
jgi:hypothetical protein